MKYIICCVIIIASFTGNKLLGQEIWTLEKCIEHAKANNLHIKQSELGVELSEANLLQSKLGLLPSLNGSTSHGFNFGRSIDPTTNDYENQKIKTFNLSLGSNTVLFSGFRKLNTVKQSQFELMASRADMESMQNDITLSIVATYLQILFNKELVRLSSEQAAITKMQIERTQKLVNAGSVPEGELLQVQAQFETEKFNVISTQNQLDISILDLMILLELELTEPIDVADPVLSIQLDGSVEDRNVENIYKIAEQTQPTIKSAEYREKSFERSLAIARGGQSPTLSFYGNIGTNYSSISRQVKEYLDYGKQQTGEVIHNTDTLAVMSVASWQAPVYENTPFNDQIDQNLSQVFGLSMNIPIFNGWQTRISVNKAKITLLNANYSKQIAKNSLKQSVYKAYTDAKASGQNFVAAQRSVVALLKNHNYVQKKYDQGLISFFELSTSQNNLNRARSELLQGKYEYVFKLKILDFYQGKPITL